MATPRGPRVATVVLPERRIGDIIGSHVSVVSGSLVQGAKSDAAKHTMSVRVHARVGSSTASLAS